jgi:fucose 4-O-acetylase-like acetyltransferase
VSAERDRFVDLVRGGSIVLVVLGHWLVADLVWADGRLEETSALAEAPALWPLSWLVAVIPLFFFVGGFSNARSWAGTTRRGEGYGTFVDRRMHRALVPLLVYLAVVVPLGLLVDLGGGLGVRAGGAMLLQPLWFLGVYVVVVALTPVTLAAHRRWGWAVPAALLLVAIVVDLLVLVGGQAWVGTVNVFVIWFLVHQLGYVYGDGRLTPAVAAVLATGLVGAVVLTQVDALPYPSTMVGAGAEVGNMHPPNVVAMALGIGAVGAAVLARPVLERWLARPRVWRAVVVLNLSVMTLYLWHQAASVLAARLVLPLGVPAPEPGTVSWWALRLFWLVLPGLVLVALVAVFGRFERIAAPPPTPDSAVTRRSAAVAVLLLGAGVLVLAGSDATAPFQARPGLGAVEVSALMGVTLTLAAAWVLRAARQGDRAARAALLGSAVALVAAAAGSAAGVGPLESERAVAGTLLAVAALAAAAGLAPVSGRRPPRAVAAAPAPPSTLRRR